MNAKRQREFTITVELTKDLARKLQETSKDLGVSKSEITRKALDGYLDYLEKVQRKLELDKKQMKIWDY